MHLMTKYFNPYIHVGISTQTRCKTWDFGGPIAGVGNDNYVGFELVFMRFNERDEAWRAHFFFAFDENLNIYAQIVA